MIRLSLTVYEDSTLAVPLADWSSIAQGVTFETDEHGFGDLSVFVPMTLEESFRVYDSLHFAHLLLSDGASVAFEGRIEDPSIELDGIRVTAFGYWRALSDVHYTSLWSTRDLSEWRPLTADDVSSAAPEKYHMDKTERVFVGLRADEEYASGADYGEVAYQYPDAGRTYIERVTWDFDLTLPTNYIVRLISYRAGFTNATEEDRETGDGANDTGSTDITLTNTPVEHVSFRIENSTGGATSPAGDNDDYFFTATNIRVQGTISANIYADEIAEDIVSYVNTINSTQLSSSTALIDSPAIELNEIVYEDEKPIRVLTQLAAMGDSSGNAWETGVWEDQRLHFRQRGSAGQAWYADLGDISIDSTADSLMNSTYAVYRSPSGRTERTAVSTDSASVSRYGVKRIAPVAARTTDSTESVEWRDTFLEDNKDITPRARLEVGEIFTASGASADLHNVRAGDTLHIRSLPVGSGGVVDKIRSFYIARTRYSVDDDTIIIYPASELPELSLLVARNTAR